MIIVGESIIFSLARWGQFNFNKQKSVTQYDLSYVGKNFFCPNSCLEICINKDEDVIRKLKDIYEKNRVSEILTYDYNYQEKIQKEFKIEEKDFYLYVKKIGLENELQQRQNADKIRQKKLNHALDNFCIKGVNTNIN